jgi:hypothetical protein
MLREASVALVSAALLLAGCGEDDGVSTADDQETAADDQETADQAIAAVEQALRDDGFTASPDDETQDLPFQSEACRELEEVAFLQSGQEVPGETARARSGPFDRGRDESTGRVEEAVRAGVTFIAEPKDLDPFFEMLNDERLTPCMEEEMRTFFEEEADESEEAVDIGDVEFELLGGEGLGDAGGGFQGTIEIMTPGFTYRFLFAEQWVRVDRAVVAVYVVAVGNEEPNADRTALLQILVDGVSDQSA